MVQRWFDGWSECNYEGTASGGVLLKMEMEVRLGRVTRINIEEENESTMDGDLVINDNKLGCREPTSAMIERARDWG